MKKQFLIVFLFSFFLTFFCGQAYAKKFVQYGWASWYGPEFHGRRTASGEPYNMYAYTAAHPTLPFGTYLIVTNLSNGKKVIVRVNDRGPFKKGRIIDLSYAAAKKLGIVGSGTAYVKIEIFRLPPGASPLLKVKYYSVQVGAFRDIRNARRWKGKIRGLIWWRIGMPLFIKKEGELYKVLVGRFRSRSKAERWKRFFRKRGISCMVIAVYR